MSENFDQDNTLPSVAVALPGYGDEPVLTLTIVFHPQLSRIGQSAVLSASPAGAPAGAAVVLGRNSLLFAHRGDPVERPLQDQYISRRALEFEFSGNNLILRRQEDASRSLINGCELQSEITLSPAQLETGAAILLAHTVVLMLRYTERAGNSGAQPPANATLLGSSGYMCALRRQIAQAAGSDLDVLIRGETGTGKELVASAIHSGSQPGKAPLVTVNMAAIPPALAAASLFGAARGAYTGADRATQGYFQQARGGTLFLDEIGEAPAEVQPQLLRALQQRELQCVGGPVQKVELRVIAATDAELEGEGCDFKSALRHRLGAFAIDLQPLRNHPEDIGELLMHFLQHALLSVNRAHLLPAADSDPVLVAGWASLFYRLVSFSWPGNVRQLENFAAQIALASEEHLVLPCAVGQALDSGMDEQSGEEADADTSFPPGERVARPTFRAMQSVDEEAFDHAMLFNQYEVSAVAKYLGVSRPAVYRRIDASPRYRLASEIPEPELRQVMQDCDGNPVDAALRLRVSLVSLRLRIRPLRQVS